MSKRYNLIGEKFGKLTVIEKTTNSNNKQYTFPDCVYKRPLKFDFAVFNDDKISLLIEYDGKQHYHPVDFFGGQKGFDDAVRRDKIKDEYCASHNIPLLRLKYDLNDNEIKEKITNIIYP